MKGSCNHMLLLFGVFKWHFHKVAENRLFFTRPLGSAIFCKRDFVLLRPLSRKSSSIPTFPCCSAKDGEQKSPRCRCHERKLCIEAGCTDARLLLCACLCAADCVSVWVWTKHSARKPSISPKDDPRWVQKSRRCNRREAPFVVDANLFAVL